MFAFRYRVCHSSAGILLVCGLLLLGAVGCDKAVPAAVELPPPAVTVAEVVQQETLDYDEYNGTTAASEIVEVRARVNGFLKQVDFKDGDYVTENQLLYAIEPDEYDAIHKQSLSRIAVSESKRDLAKSKLARNEKLVAQNAVSREEYEESIAAVREGEALVASSKADANRTALDLKYTQVLAPIAGRIDKTYVTKGNLVTGGLGSGTLLTRIVREQPMYVYFDVDEASLLRYMALGQTSSKTKGGSLRELEIECLAQLANEREFPHRGKLDFAANQVDRDTGTVRVRGVFANDPRVMASGLFVRVRIPIGEPYQALLVPERAIATDQNIKYVYVVGSDATAERRLIELGPQRGELRIVKPILQAGDKVLKTGDKVIVKGLQRVRPGQKLDVHLESAAAAPAVEQPAVEQHGDSAAER